MDATWKSNRGKPHVVYVLGDPRTMLPRYVGCTVNLHKRYLGHLRGQSGTKVKRWVKELRSLGLKPLVLPIQQTARAYEGENAEQKWIAYFWRRASSSAHVHTERRDVAYVCLGKSLRSIARTNSTKAFEISA